MENFDLVTTIRQEAGTFLADHGLELFYEAHYLGSTLSGIVVFMSEACQLQLTLDRGVVQAYVGPKTAPMPGCPDSPQQWFDMLTVVPFLTSGRQVWRYDSAEDVREFAERVRRQVAAIGTGLREHWPAISQAFSRGTFPQSQPGLMQFEAEGQRRFLENVQK